MAISSSSLSSFSSTLVRTDSQRPNSVASATQTPLGAQMSAARNCGATRAVVPQRLPVRDDYGDLLGVTSEQRQSDILERKIIVLTQKYAQLEQKISAQFDGVPAGDSCPGKRFRTDVLRAILAEVLDKHNPNQTASLDHYLALQLDVLRQIEQGMNGKQKLALLNQQASGYSLHQGICRASVAGLIPNAVAYYVELLCTLAQDSSLSPQLVSMVKDVLYHGSLLNVTQGKPGEPDHHLGVQLGLWLHDAGLLSVDKQKKLDKLLGTLEAAGASCPNTALGERAQVLRAESDKQRACWRIKLEHTGNVEQRQRFEAREHAHHALEANGRRLKEEDLELRQQLLGDFFDQIAELTEAAIEARQAKEADWSDEPTDEGSDSSCGDDASQTMECAESSVGTQSRREQRATQLREGVGEFANQYGPNPSR